MSSKTIMAWPPWIHCNGVSNNPDSVICLATGQPGHYKIICYAKQITESPTSPGLSLQRGIDQSNWSATTGARCSTWQLSESL